jgi:hypothetical protein
VKEAGDGTAALGLEEDSALTPANRDCPAMQSLMASPA